MNILFRFCVFIRKRIMKKVVAVYFALCKERINGSPVGYCVPYASHGICHDFKEEMECGLNI